MGIFRKTTLGSVFSNLRIGTLRGNAGQVTLVSTLAIGSQATAVAYLDPRSGITVRANNDNTASIPLEVDDKNGAILLVVSAGQPNASGTYIQVNGSLRVLGPGSFKTGITAGSARIGTLRAGRQVIGSLTVSRIGTVLSTLFKSPDGASNRRVIIQAGSSAFDGGVIQLNPLSLGPTYLQLSAGGSSNASIDLAVGSNGNGNRVWVSIKANGSVLVSKHVRIGSSLLVPAITLGGVRLRNQPNANALNIAAGGGSVLISKQSGTLLFTTDSNELGMGLGLAAGYLRLRGGTVYAVALTVGGGNFGGAPGLLNSGTATFRATGSFAKRVVTGTLVFGGQTGGRVRVQRIGRLGVGGTRRVWGVYPTAFAGTPTAVAVAVVSLGANTPVIIFSERPGSVGVKIPNNGGGGTQFVNIIAIGSA